MSDFLIRHTGLVIGLIAAAAGMSATLVVWLWTRSVSEVPPEDRQYKDRPPLVFRLVWLLLQWLCCYIAPMVPASTHAALLVRLRKAGLEYSLSPVQFIASRALCAGMLALGSWWLLGSLDFTRGGGVSSVRLLQIAVGSALLGWFLPALWLRDRLALRRHDLLRALPFFLDVITLCVEAGLNMQGAITQAVAKGPKGVMSEEMHRVMRDIRSGKPRATALRDMAQRLNEPGITNFTMAVVQAEKMGMSLGPVLRAQADQRRSERFLRAEKLAMEAPVKMLFPLIAFIFPCTFVVLFFPIFMKFMDAGL